MHGLGRENTEFMFQHINHAALAGLTVDSDQAFILSAHVGGVQMKIGNFPALMEVTADFLAFFQTFADGILMGA